MNVCRIIILLLLLVHSRIDHHQEEEVVEVIDAEVEGTEIQNDTLERTLCNKST